ncbi:MAG: helix-turn-helix domain-containing protein [Christensenellales bacterium]
MIRLNEAAQKAAYIFEKATTIPCTTINLQAEDALEQRKGNAFCETCAKEQMARFSSLQCDNIHKYASYQADKWGGKYEYLCPAGATFIAASLISDFQTGYGIIVGPFLMVDYTEFKEDDLERFFKSSIPDAVIKKILGLPYIECSRVSYLADMLFMIIAYMGERDSVDARIMQQTAKNQSEFFYSQYNVKPSGDANYSYQIEGERLLQQYISQGDRVSAQKIINEMLGNIFFCSGGNFEVIKARVTELVVLLSRAAIVGGASAVEVFGLNEDYLNTIHKFKDLDELNHWLAKVLMRFTNIVLSEKEPKYSDIIKEAITYIRANYMNKLSLNDISNHVKYSVSYLSKIFKEETGENLSTFINRTRIDNSRMMLLTTNLPIVEVSYLSGFDDQSYYTKVFRKMTGLSPGKFRENRGRSETM